MSKQDIVDTDMNVAAEGKANKTNQVQVTTLTFTLGDILKQRQNNKNKKV